MESKDQEVTEHHATLGESPMETQFKIRDKHQGSHLLHVVYGNADNESPNLGGTHHDHERPTY